MTAQATWGALGTTAVLRLSEPAGLERAQAAVQRELDDIDRAASRFRDDSELAQINRAGGRAVRVSGLMCEALELALRAAEVTGGDVDPTVGRALMVAGYDADFGEIVRRPRPDRLTVSVQPLCDWRAVRFDDERREVRVPAGMALDLGATAKALAADRAAAAAADAAGCGALVGLGGDIAVAGDAPPEGWLVHVTDDHRSPLTTPGQTISIASGGLATSSVTVRRWPGGHHIIDPRRGVPTTRDLRTVSVAAGSCADANIASTASIVRGLRAAREWLSAQELPARLVEHDGSVHRVGDWPHEAVAA